LNSRNATARESEIKRDQTGRTRPGGMATRPPMMASRKQKRKGRKAGKVKRNESNEEET
jgi:hypothetical protein